MGYKEEFIEFMVRSKVLTFGEFTTKSGRKTPYFINTGNYQTGEQIAKLGEYYAACVKERVGGEVDALYGPAYKGIPLAVTTAASLYKNHGLNVPYCFNRKEAKDHGEGGLIVGYQPKDGDNVVIIEDVITAGTALRENLPIIQGAARVHIKALIVSADRMERGTGEKSAIQEVQEEFGISVYPIVTIRDILTYLYGREIDGKVWVDDVMKVRIESYLEMYGV